MDEHTPEVPFCLTIFVPLKAVQSMTVLQDCRAAGLSLQKTGIRSYCGEFSLQFIYIIYGSLGNRPIGVIGDVIHIFSSSPLGNPSHRLHNVFPARACGGKRANLHFRVNFTYCLCGTHEKIGI